MISTSQDRHFERDAIGMFSVPGRSREYDVNIGNLKKIIDYLSSLKTEGKLNDKQFSNLVTHLCSNFIEAEMAALVNKVLGKTIKKIFGEYI